MHFDRLVLMFVQPIVGKRQHWFVVGGLTSPHKTAFESVSFFFCVSCRTS
jgi:hypothetical protein